MKKLLGLLTLFMLIGTVSFAQNKTGACYPPAKNAKCCTPSEACAKAMGISLEECKRMCGEKATSTANNAETTNAKAKFVAQKTNCSPKDCAKSCNMTVAECQKICGTKNGTTQKAANVKLVSQKTPAAKCCKIPNCCKKGVGQNTSTASN